MSQVFALLALLTLSASFQILNVVQELLFLEAVWEAQYGGYLTWRGSGGEYRHKEAVDEHISHAESLKTLVEQWVKYKEQCNLNISSEPPAMGVVCNRTFDRYACWPDGQPNSTVRVACPWYLPWHHKVQNGFVYWECGPDGQWVHVRNTTECEEDDQRYGRILSKVRAMYTVGYSISLGALVLALGILMAFRRLHCMRNNIHMNLFASFILRALSILLKDALLDKVFVNIPPYDIANDCQVELQVSSEVAIGCRITMVMMQYSIMANNYWLLVEGIYLYNLLVVTVFTERNYFTIYLCIGWGAPLIFVLPWVIVKYLYENKECWEKNYNMWFWWIIRSPILLAVLINFFIFIQIIRILMSKLRAHQMRYTDYKFRLAKSTLTLIPLLGIHIILSAFVTDEQVQEGPLRLAKLFYDLFFNSFQGLLVAVLYCFVNKEVQSEMIKKWKRWKLGNDIEEQYRHSHTPHIKGSIVLHMPCPLKSPDPGHPSGSHEENCRLVPAKLDNGLQFPPLPQGDSSCSTLIENICLEDKMHCCMPGGESAENDF